MLATQMRNSSHKLSTQTRKGKQRMQRPPGLKPRGRRAQQTWSGGPKQWVPRGNTAAPAARHSSASNVAGHRQGLATHGQAASAAGCKLANQALASLMPRCHWLATLWPQQAPSAPAACRQRLPAAPGPAESLPTRTSRHCCRWHSQHGSLQAKGAGSLGVSCRAMHMRCSHAAVVQRMHAGQW